MTCSLKDHSCTFMPVTRGRDGDFVAHVQRSLGTPCSPLKQDGSKSYQHDLQEDAKV